LDDLELENNPFSSFRRQQYLERTAVARLPLRELGVLVTVCCTNSRPTTCTVTNNLLLQSVFCTTDVAGQSASCQKHPRERKNRGIFFVAITETVIRTKICFYCFYSAPRISHSAALAIVNPSVGLSVTRWHCVKKTQATIMRSSL